MREAPIPSAPERIESGTARNAARFDGTSWHELGAGTDQVIWTSARFYNELYVGGDFDSAGGFAANQLARWNLDGGEWSDIGGIRRDFLPGVNAIATNGRTLYVGGSFDTIAGIEARNVARFDGADWSPLGSGVDNFIYEMAASEGKLFVAGAFTSAGSKPSIYFGIYYDPLLGVDDATTTSILDLSVAPNPATSRGTVAFSTTRNQSVALRIYDPLGRVITTIFEREVPAGDHRIITEAFDHLPSGHYRLVLTTEQENSSIGVTIER